MGASWASWDRFERFEVALKASWRRLVVVLEVFWRHLGHLGSVLGRLVGFSGRLVSLCCVFVCLFFAKRKYIISSYDFWWFQTIPNDFRQMISDRQFQIISDDFRGFQTIPDDFRWFQIIPDDSRWSQMIPSSGIIWNHLESSRIVWNHLEFPSLAFKGQEADLLLSTLRGATVESFQTWYCSSFSKCWKYQ